MGVERTTWNVIDVRDGKVASEHAYLNEAEALEAAAAFRSARREQDGAGPHSA